MNLKPVLPVILGATFVLLDAHAQSDIEEIVVEEKYFEETIPLELSRYGSRVEVITGDEIRERGFLDISQALQMLVPGLYMAPKNGPFDYFNASLQGSRSQDILWLIDGVRISNRLYNTTTPLDTVPAHMVERVEVLKGGQGIFYGTQSVAGVVNIVTKAFTGSSEGQASGGVHTNDGYNVNAFYRGSSGNNQFVVYASRDDADGITPFREEHYQPSSTDRNRGYEVNTLGLKYAYNFGDTSRLMLHYQHTDNEVDFARPTDVSSAFNDRKEDLVTAKWDYQANENASVFVKAYYHKWDSRFTEIHNDLDNPGQFITIDDESFWGYEDYGLNAMTRFNFHEGAEYVLGYDHQQFSGQDDVLLIADQKEKVNALFFQARSTEEWLANTRLAAGARYNKQSDAGSTTLWNLSGKHSIGGGDTFFRANIGTAFRLPDAWQLFGNDPCCTRGNPQLEGEESFNINVGLGSEFAGVGEGMSWEVIGFHRTVDNLIGSSDGMRVNTENEVEMIGAELVASLSISDQWSTTLDFVYTQAEEKESDIQIADIPRQTVKWLLNYEAQNRPFGLSVSLLYVDDVYSDVGGFFETGEFVNNGNYAVLDLSGHYQLGNDERHMIVFRLENLTDEDYASSVRTASTDVSGEAYLYDNLGVPRTLHLSYTYRF
jgi:outer membrane cobalamin receptor